VGLGVHTPHNTDQINGTPAYVSMYVCDLNNFQAVLPHYSHRMSAERSIANLFENLCFKILVG
jgi:hypothetical protein